MERISDAGDCFCKDNPNKVSKRRQPPPLSSGASRNFRGDTEGVTMPAVVMDTDVEIFDEVLRAAEVQGSGTLMLLFLGNRNSTGESWCPVCTKAERIIYNTVNAAEEPVTLVRVHVGDRSTWMKTEHALRKDPRFALKVVPTLIRWENGGITERLEDRWFEDRQASEADMEDKIKKLVS